MGRSANVSFWAKASLRALVHGREGCALVAPGGGGRRTRHVVGQSNFIKHALEQGPAGRPKETAAAKARMVDPRAIGARQIATEPGPIQSSYRQQTESLRPRPAQDQ